MLITHLQHKTLSNPTFGKMPQGADMDKFTQDMKEGLSESGLDKSLSLIIHGPSFPATEGQDTGMGSPYSDGAKDVLTLLKHLSFDKYILGPDGDLGKTYDSKGNALHVDVSPYDKNTSSFAGNILFIDLNKLATPEWGNILSPKTLVETRTDTTSKESDYAHALKNYDKALKEAFQSFKAKRLSGDMTAKKLGREFRVFKKENKDWLESEAVYNTLLIEHADDTEVKENYNHFKFWNSETDKNLYKDLNGDNPELKQTAQNRLDELNKNEHTEQFKFNQFILDKMKKESLTPEIKAVADRKVSFSNVDVWANPDAFLDGWCIGCPPDFFDPEGGQNWGFPVINPATLFERDKNGEIKKENGKPVYGEAGKLIYRIFDKTFKENPGGVRIDHIIGLIDPWIYPEDEKPNSPRARRLFSSPDHEQFGEFAKISVNDLDETTRDNENKELSSERIENNFRSGLNLVKEEALDDKAIARYAEIIDQIIMPAAKENNVTQNDIVFEDLGAITSPVRKLFEKYKLPGLKVTEYVNVNEKDHEHRAINVPPYFHASMGTHDNDTLVAWTRERFDCSDANKHANRLAKDVAPQFPKKFKQKILENSRDFANAKFAEALIGPYKNLQIMFTDLFGTKERYNFPGRPPVDYFKLRTPEKPVETYFKRVEEHKAPNLPEIMAMALEAKQDATKQPLIKKLKNWADYLYEKS